MEYTNPLLGLTSSRIATAPDPGTLAELSVPTSAESSMPSPASQEKIPNSSTPLQPGTLAAEASEVLGGASAKSDSTRALGKPQLGNGGAKKAPKMRPGKTSTAR